MQVCLEYLNSCSLPTLFLLFLLENVLIAFLAVFIGFALDGLLSQMSTIITRKEIYWACSTVFCNSVVTLLGYELFRHGFMVFNLEFSLLSVLIDFTLLILIMDFLMYVFHWAIHRFRMIYKYHDLHHVYSSPSAISLFVLHPVEVFGFGILWLCLLMVVDFSIYAIMLYLIFNVAMGMAGHLRKEIVPVGMRDHVVFRWFANTGFHVGHHEQENHNFGFYTKLWDRLFGTLK